MADKSWLSRLFGKGTSASDARNESGGASSNPSSPKLLSSPINYKNLLNDRDSLPLNGSPSSTQNLHNARYFDPTTALGNGVPSSTRDIFVDTEAASSRKRQFLGSPPAVESTITSSRVKRFRENMANTSVVEQRPSFASAFPSRLDTTWAAATDSPASSSISLRSRISLAPSASTKLSSKTRAILEQLERVSNPALDSKKVALTSNGGPIRETWNTSSLNKSMSAVPSTATPPPLRRQSVQVPSRVQLLSTSMAAHYKKPYWRDLSRSTTLSAKTSDLSMADIASPASIQRVKNNETIKVSPLFDLNSSCAKESPAPKTSRTPVLKAPDGKKTTNTFNTKDLDQDSDTEYTDAASGTEWLSKSKGLPTFAAPAKGFLDDLVFSFTPPTQRGPSQKVEESESSDSGSGSDESESEVTTSDSEKDNEEESNAKKRPDSETSASAVATPVSSKNTSPQSNNATPIAAASVTGSNWTCSECFVPNKASDAKCVCCGFVHDKQAAASAPVFGAKTFEAPAAPKGVSFGFGAVKLAEEKKDATIKPSIPTVVVTKVESTPIAKPTESTASSDRKPWECPDCFVNNKATDSKCPCCGHEKYKDSGATEAPKSAFGDKAFKPSAPAGVSFGFGTSTAVAPADSTSAPKFGFGTSKPAEPVGSISTVEKTTEAPKATPAFGFGLKPSGGSTASVSSASSFGLPKTDGIFGSSSATLTVPSFSIGKSSEDQAAASIPASTEPPASASTSIFGAAAASVKPISGLTATSSQPLFSGLSSTLSTTTSTAAPTMPPSTTSASGTSIFGAALGSSPLFGTSKPLFGASAPAAAAPSPAVDSSSTAPSATLTTTTSTPAPIFGALTKTTGSEGAKPLFGSGSSLGAPSIFGAGATNAFSSTTLAADGPSEAKKAPVFGSLSSSTASTGGFNFGPVATTTSEATPMNSTNGFNFSSNGNGFAASSSAPNLFGSAAPQAPAPAAAAVPSFGAPTAPPTSFNFGGASSSATSTAPFVFGASAPSAPSQPFMFGQTAPAAPSAGQFGFGAAAPFAGGNAFNAADSPFAFNAGPAPSATSMAGRKLAHAKRRFTVKK